MKEERIVSRNELPPMHHDVYLDKADLGGLVRIYFVCTRKKKEISR